MKTIKINLFEGSEVYGILTIDNNEGGVRYFHNDNEMNLEYMENFNSDIFAMIIRLAEFICFNNDAKLKSY